MIFILPYMTLACGAEVFWHPLHFAHEASASLALPGPGPGPSQATPVLASVVGGRSQKHVTSAWSLGSLALAEASCPSAALSCPVEGWARGTEARVGPPWKQVLQPR